MIKKISLILIGLSGTILAQIPENHPLSHDRTGMPWVVPFAKAQTIAKEQKRILLIKPIAFGTDKAGCW